VLADPQKRAQYDRFGHAGMNGGGFGGFDATIFQDFSDIFGDLFGFGDIFGAGGSRRRSRAQRGGDVRKDLTLEFEEAIFGATKEITVRVHAACEECNGSGSEPGQTATSCTTCNGHGQVRYQQGFFSISRTCPNCGGTGSTITHPCKRCKGEGRVIREKVVPVKVPAGVEEGTRILFSGQGEAGGNGGPAAISTLCSTSKIISSLTRRQGHLLRNSNLVHTGRAGRENSYSHSGWRTDPGHSGRHTDGDNFPIKGREFRCSMPRQRRPVRRGESSDSRQAHKSQRELLEELGSSIQVENKPQPKSLLSKVKDLFG